MAMIPSTVGGSVYSVLPSNGDGDFNFTRASAATRINAQGLIETVAVGDNRLNYPLLDGTVQTCPHLLLEGQRTNLITYSESFSNAAWTKGGTTVTSNAAISPDGTETADALVFAGTSGQKYITKSSIAYPVGEVTYSCFVKKGTLKGVGLRVASISIQFFDIENLSVEGYEISQPISASIKSYGNGWVKISMTVATTSTGNCNVYVMDEINTSKIATGTVGDEMLYVWGAQVEAGSYSTSYIVSNSG